MDRPVRRLPINYGNILGHEMRLSRINTMVEDGRSPTTDMPLNGMSTNGNGSSIEQFMKMRQEHHNALGMDKRMEMAETAIKQLDKKLIAINNRLAHFEEKVDDGIGVLTNMIQRLAQHNQMDISSEPDDPSSSIFGR